MRASTFHILYTVHCTLYTVHCTLYTVHCTVLQDLDGRLYVPHMHSLGGPFQFLWSLYIVETNLNSFKNFIQIGLNTYSNCLDKNVCSYEIRNLNATKCRVTKCRKLMHSTLLLFSSNADFLKVEALRNHPYSTFFI